MTLNVLDFADADGETRRAVVARRLRELAPDVVALQEVPTDRPDEIVSELLGAGYAVVAHPTDSPDGVGALLASRWPLAPLHTEDLRLTDRSGDLPWSFAVFARVDAPAPLGPVLVVHPKPAWTYRLEHEREIAAVRTSELADGLTAEQGIEHVVVLGDFDAAPDHASMRFWTGRQSLGGTSTCYTDAWEACRPAEPGHTFTRQNPLVRAGTMPHGPDRRIDYVLVRCGSHGPSLQVASCALVLDQPVDGVQASDHYGVLADLSVPDRPSGSWAPDW
ncbi:endonuclease/exonuclease/phosphatase family protein [Georgenia sp. TF02-10]|uniref:endonuclease/exonuclease/phosphatase family protein n=1 Tax=Georgenia sp. TF02-10 TaxID=2917725 RepID=UPI001FA7D877|nr:endonuclease/exonuclease/phosphatase family protein [Georgenia sp. TF02-10]UNX54177.1 endonuclease/exonuclease/phosphatase family protein [Georgenia sp. TF02-10]